MKPRLAPGLFLFFAFIEALPAAAAQDAPFDETPHISIDPSRDKIIIVSRVARSVRKHQPRLEIFADWLASHLKDQGTVAGAALVARSPKEMILVLREGWVDVLSEALDEAQV